MKQARALLAAVALLALTVPAHALDSEFGLCALPAITKSKDVGAWMVWEETSKIDDSLNVFIITEVPAPILLAHGKKAFPSLTIACRENKTTLWVGAREYLNSDEISVTYRIGKLSATNRTFQLSSDRKAFGLWTGSEAIPFIKKLFGHEALLVRYIPYGDPPRMFELPHIGTQAGDPPIGGRLRVVG